MLITVPLVTLLGAAAWFDVRSFRIPNALTVSGAVAGLVLNTVLPSGIGLALALAGCALALFGLLPLYLLRIWGAGDVKLMAVVGAFVGPGALLGCLGATLVIGGIASLAAAWRARTGKLLLANLRRMYYQIVFSVQLKTLETIDAPPRSAGKVPYAIPILLGTVSYLVYSAAAL